MTKRALLLFARSALLNFRVVWRRREWGKRPLFFFSPTVLASPLLSFRMPRQCDVKKKRKKALNLVITSTYNACATSNACACGVLPRAFICTDRSCGDWWSCWHSGLDGLPSAELRTSYFFLLKSNNCFVCVWCVVCGGVV